MRGDVTARTMEDTDEMTLSYAEVKAIATGNHQIKRKTELEAEIGRMNIPQGEHSRNRFALEDIPRKK